MSNVTQIILPDDDILMMMEMNARAERDSGFPGWSKPPAELLEACERLVERGFAEEWDEKEGFFRPTKRGAKRVGHRITRAQ